MRLSALLLALVLSPVASDAELRGSSVPVGAAAPTDYRMDRFRAPVPDAVAGAKTISTEQARHLLEGGAVFVDVLRAARRPQGLPENTLWLPKKRLNIPGTLWLPDVGFGALSDELHAYFRTNLERSTGGNQDRIVVIYCLADCWMSWNAAKRAASYGYTAVHWYPEGTDGWGAAGYPLVESLPVPMD